MHPVLFELGNWPVYSYGVLLAAAYLAGLQMAVVRARHAGIDRARRGSVSWEKREGRDERARPRARPRASSAGCVHARSGTDARSGTEPHARRVHQEHLTIGLQGALDHRRIGTGYPVERGGTR